MNRRGLPWWLYASALLTTALALVSISFRYRAEARNRAITLAAEMENVQTLAASQGIPVDQALRLLKQQGLGAVVLSEESVGQLVNEGAATLDDGTIEARTPDTQTRIARGVALRYPGLNADRLTIPLIRGASAGLDPIEAKHVQDAGLLTIGRFANVLGATDAYVAGTLAWAKEHGAEIFLPMGDQVLGRRDALPALIDALGRLGMTYASPEFTKLGGDANVVGKAPNLVLRLHSAQSAELDKLTLPDAVERYAKAARERNMRVLLVRPISYADARPVDEFAEFLRAIRNATQADGLVLGRAHPFADPAVPPFLPVVIALAAMPTLYWAAVTLFRSTQPTPLTPDAQRSSGGHPPAMQSQAEQPQSNGRAMRLALGALLLLLALSSATSFGRSLAALAISIGFPTAALLSLDARKLRHPVVELLLVTGLSLAGGLAVAGMLVGLPYFVKAEAFPGVKLSVFLPVLVAGAYFLWRLADGRRVVASPITWGAAVLGLVLLGALAFMIARTGNEASAGVSPLEIQFRNLLDKLLPVRPRTKEFAIGHPALVVGIGLLAYLRAGRLRPERWGVWTALALLLGAVGQTSVVNTMCHLHTPIALSFLRIGTGLAVGAAIGAALWWALAGRLCKGEG